MYLCVPLSFFFNHYNYTELFQYSLVPNRLPQGFKAELSQGDFISCSKGKSLLSTIPEQIDIEEVEEDASGLLPCPVVQGWALRGAKKTLRFNENQRQYLDDKFEIGQESGHKADPEMVSRDMRYTRTEKGQRRFTVDELVIGKRLLFNDIQSKRGNQRDGFWLARMNPATHSCRSNYACKSR